MPWRCKTYMKAFGVRRCAGALPVALYRSRNLNGITPEQCDELRHAGIRTVYDLRKPLERDMNPEPSCVCEAFDVRTCPVDLQNDDGRTPETKAAAVRSSYGEPGARMRYLYGVMASRAQDIARMAHEIMASGAPVLVHCANGKDRVGVLCASVQWASGVPYDVIAKDYLATNACNAAMNKRDLAHYAGLMPPEEVAVLAAMFEAREEYLAVFFDCIAQEYGSVDAWVGMWRRGAGCCG